jgi:hypothetical protein
MLSKEGDIHHAKTTPLAGNWDFCEGSVCMCVGEGGGGGGGVQEIHQCVEITK